MRLRKDQEVWAMMVHADLSSDDAPVFCRVSVQNQKETIDENMRQTGRRTIYAKSVEQDAKKKTFFKLMSYESRA